jgi:dihydroorotate dehydrogenase
MIKLSNNHSFEYMTASGALGYDGKGWPWEQHLRLVGLLNPALFTSVTKTLTLKPKVGNLRWYNPLRCVRFLNDGIVNAIGLTNPGIDWWCKKIGPVVDSKKIPLIISIAGESDELVEMVHKLNGFNLVGIEINSSCPNLGPNTLQNTKKIIENCEAVKRNSNLPIVLKVSITHDVTEITKGIEGVVEAISINSIPWKLVFPNCKSPLEFFGGGGVSGKIVQKFTWELVQKISYLTTIPVIGPSIWDFDDLAKIRKNGAKAISFGSVFIPYPWRPTLYVRKEQDQYFQKFQNNIIY